MSNILEGVEVRPNPVLGLIMLTFEILMILGIICMIKYLVG